MSEVKYYDATPEGESRAFEMVMGTDFDRVTAERDAALGREAAALTELSTWNRVLRSSVPEEHKG